MKFLFHLHYAVDNIFQSTHCLTDFDENAEKEIKKRLKQKYEGRRIDITRIEKIDLLDLINE